MNKAISAAARLTVAAASAALLSMPVNALVIGHYDNSREIFGMSTGYISSAATWLTDNGHTLVSTNNADAAFLGSVDAFYTGLIDSVSDTESSSMKAFVDNGGFLFVQQDFGNPAWIDPTNKILSNWGISSSGLYAGTVSTVGTSDWVTMPNMVNTLGGSLHSAIEQSPDDFEVLAVDDQNRAVMGVLDSTAGRANNVLVATDIDFWNSENDTLGWSLQANRQMWENIWGGNGSEDETDGNQTGDGSGSSNGGGGGNDIATVPEPSTLVLLGIGLFGLSISRRTKA